ncbi:MAG: DMT family transporter [Candidatus Gastranaerophilales bacterium]|nr:DMT family transporter [Candidatus Gastranaerophilales bacterium]
MNKVSIIAILSAVFYGISIPFSKIMLIKGVNPMVLGGLTYLGAGFGLLLFSLMKSFKKERIFQNPLGKKEFPYAVLMVFFDIFAILFLMYGLSKTNSANASLLSNFEIVSTSIIAFIFFKEKISKKLWFAIILIIIASIILTYEGSTCLDFTFGSVFVLCAYLFWGMENNCTKMISSKNIFETTIIKGVCSGIGSLIIAYFAKCEIPAFNLIFAILIMGLFSYGISVLMYIYSQNKLGAAKTASYFSYAPYIGIFASIIILKELPSFHFLIAFIIMLFAGCLIYKDNKND